jgi:CRP-like cAMP-binding protein
MTHNDDDNRPWGNLLLDSLPDNILREFVVGINRVDVARGTITTRAGEPLRHVDFPIDAVIAVIAETPSGKTVEAAVIGREGYVETDAPFGSNVALRTAICRLPGSVWRMDIGAFRAHLRDEVSLVQAMRRATRARMYVMEQAVLCNAHHTMDQRLARWLLEARDRSGREHFRVTQAELAGVLGVRRAGISLTVARLRRAGAVTNERGAMIVTNYNRLRGEACECYGVMRAAVGGMLE